MRHGKKLNHLGRKAPHRRAMMANMASSLIKHKKITTTVAKAKALRMFVEPLITKGKNNTTHNHRTVFAYLRDKEAVHELFTVVGEKVANRPGGYTRILKIGNRAGDNADMAMIELVDFNEFFTGHGQDRKGGSKRTRRGRSKSGATTNTETTPVVVETVGTEAFAEVAETDAPEVLETTETEVSAVEEIAAEEIVEEAVQSEIVETETTEENPAAEVSAETTDASSEETAESSEDSDNREGSGEENKPE